MPAQEQCWWVTHRLDMTLAVDSTSTQTSNEDKLTNTWKTYRPAISPPSVISERSMRPSSYAWIWKLLLQGWTGVYLFPSHTPFSFLPRTFSLLPLFSPFTHLSLLQSLSRFFYPLIPFSHTSFFSPTLTLIFSFFPPPASLLPYHLFDNIRKRF